MCLPIGGLKEKLLAAHRGGIRIVIIPDENARDLKEIPDNIKRDLDIRPVKWMDDVMKIALERMPEALAEPIVEGATQLWRALSRRFRSARTESGYSAARSVRRCP